MNDAAEQSNTQNDAPAPVKYELSLDPAEAAAGTSKLLPRNGKRLQVNIPAGVVSGSLVRLTNALQVTDGRPGDILIAVRIKEPAPPPPQGPSPEEQPPAEGIENSDTTYQSEVLRSDLPVVVDFWAPWCGPCRMMAPVMEKAAQDYQGRLKFCKINVDENPASAQQFQAMSIPMLLVFKNGQVIDKSVGALPEYQLKAKLDGLGI